MLSVRNFLRSSWEVLEVVFIATATVFVIRTFLVQPFLVSGASMEKNFSDGDYLIVDEITQRFREFDRGEVIVFRYPRNPSTFFIKRIIGLPGEQVFSENGQIKIRRDGQVIALDEKYLSAEALTSHDNFPSMTLGQNQYFVLGDNRLHSFDSRSWGTVGREYIIGTARLILFPFNKFQFIESPAYTGITNG